MKLTVIGGGGVRSMFLAKSIAQRAQELGIQTLVFMDNNPEKLRIYGKMAAHVAHKICPSLAFILTQDAMEAVRDADYVITTIRAGEDLMRTKDEHIALDHGVLGQETTGAAGFSFAMRSIPALVSYCDLIRAYAKPQVKVFNFTNPAGVVSQALRDKGYDFTYGICDAPSGMLRQFAALYDADPDTIRGEIYGLNHHSFFQSIQLHGRNIVPELIENPLAYQKTDMRFFSEDLVRFVGEVPNEYLYYFYYREQAVANILKAGVTRGDSICEINEQMTKELSTMDIDNDFEACLAVFSKWYGIREANYMASETGVTRNIDWHFDINEKDAGGYAGVALKFIEIERLHQKDSMVLCVPNNGAIDGLLPSDVIEVTCDIDANGCHPHRFANIPPTQMEMIRRTKAYERLASQAILQRDQKKAIECLLLHPLVNSYSLSQSLVSKYIALNADFIQGWA